MANLKEHGLIVSCQAVKGEPLYGLHMMGHFARAAVLGDAAGIRANYVEDINEITAKVDVPVIGIIKAEYPTPKPYNPDAERGQSPADNEVLRYCARCNKACAPER